MEKDYYKILGVSREATKEEIKNAYYRLALKYHPDKNKDVKVRKRFREIVEAYSILSDDEKRRAYDMKEKGGKISHEDIYKVSDFSDLFHDVDREIVFNDLFNHFFKSKEKKRR